MRWVERPSITTRGAITVIVFATFLGMVGVTIWGLRRGFDFTDEGFYMLSYAAAPEDSWGLSRFGLIVRRVLFFADHNVLALRVVRLLLVLGANVILAWGLAAWVDRRKSVWTFIAAVGVGTHLGWTFGPQTLSYNHLTAVLLLTAAGLVLIGIAATTERHRLALALAGSALGVLWFVKFTAAALAVVALAAMVLITGRALRPLGHLAAGFGFAVLAYFVVVESPASWWRAFTADLVGQGSGDHSASRLWDQYYGSLETALTIGGRLWPAWLALFVGTVVARQGWVRDRTLVVLLGAAVLVIAAVRMEGRIPLDDFRYISIAVAWWLIALVAVLAIRFGLGQFGGKRWAVLLMLAVMPFVGAAGTDNPLFTATIFYLGFWFGAIAMEADRLAGAGRSGLAFGTLVPIVLITLIPLQRAYIDEPYRLPTDLASQSIAAPAGTRLEGLLLDPATAAAVADITNRGRDLGLHDLDVLGMYDVPGVIWLVGAHAPVVPWVADRPGSPAYACERLIDADVDLSAVFVIRATPEPPLPCLDALGVDWPEGYRLAATIDQPADGGIIELWAPR